MSDWLAHLGEDRVWFTGWIAFGNAPTHNPELYARYVRCWDSLSKREIEECRVVAHANTIDVVSGTDKAFAYMEVELEVIKKKYEEEDKRKLLPRGGYF